MLVIQTSIPLVPARREEALELVGALVETARGEDGTVRYHATTDLADPNVVRFFEAYEDADAVEAHGESDAYRAFVEALPTVADGEIETVQFETDSVETVTFSADEAVAALD